MIQEAGITMNHPPPSPRKQRGWSIMQVALGLTLTGLAAALALDRWNESQTASLQQSAFLETVSWLTGMYEFGVLRNFTYTGLDHTDLLAESSIEDANNVFGLAITITVTGTNWQLNYPFPDTISCEYVQIRIVGLPGVAGVPACNGATLEAVID